jgi:3'-5' exoribonuclease
MSESLFDSGNGNAAGNGVAAAGRPDADGTAAEPRPVLSELDDGQDFSGAFVVRERELRQKKNGDDFLKLTLGDRTGSVPAICWDRVAENFEACATGAIVVITGRFSVHPQFGRQIKLGTARPAESHEYEEGELTEGPARPVAQLESELRDLLDTIQNDSLRALLDRLFCPRTAAWKRLREAPAATHYHAAHAGGLLEHTLSVAQAVSAAANFFGGIDREVAVTGALLHDIGKTEAYNDDPLAIDMTDAGRLQAEIPLGYYKVRRQIEEIEGFDTGLAQAVLHIILSHHGQLEHGSPVVPCTREAALVHAMDNLGGKLGSFDRLEKELGDGESWSRFDRGIESAAFFGSRAA